MDIRQITATYFVAPQIDPADLPDIAAAGIKTIICNRPDVENPPSHQAETMEIAVKAAGLKFHVLPLTHQTMTQDIIAQHMQLSQDDAPVLAYCASGTRCTIAWALGMAMAGMDPDEILAITQNGGYSLEQIRPTLAAYAKPAE